MPKKQDNIVNSLAHTKWNCKYHIVFAPKYRRKIFYEEKRLAIRDIYGKAFFAKLFCASKKATVSRAFQKARTFLPTSFSYERS